MVAVATTDEDVFVEVFTVDEDAFVEVFTVDEAALELVTPLPEHVPKEELQPVEQWSVVEPHHPYLVHVS